MKKNDLPFVIAIPLAAVLIVIVVAVLVSAQAGKAMPPKEAVMPESGVPTTVGGGKAMTETATISAGPTAAPKNAATNQNSDLSKELDSTVDDGGATELDALNKDAASL